MFTSLSGLRKALIYYGIVFALVTGIAFVPLDGQTMLVTAMALPTLATLLMLLVVTRDGYARAGWSELGLHRAGIRTWPLAIVGPLGVLTVAYATVWSTGLATFAPPSLDAMGWISGLGNYLFQGLVVTAVTFSLGEELGWRGYLLPKLAAALGPGRGMALTGFLHGLFHMPIIFLTPFYHADGNRWLIVPLFLITFTIGGLLYGYLRLSSGSIWPASLAHSAHNSFWALFGSMTVAASPLASEYLGGETGLLPIAGYGLLAVWLLPRLRRHSAGVVRPGLALPSRA